MTSIRLDAMPATAKRLFGKVFFTYSKSCGACQASQASPHLGTLGALGASPSACAGASSVRRRRRAEHLKRWHRQRNLVVAKGYTPHFARVMRSQVDREAEWPVKAVGRPDMHRDAILLTLRTISYSFLRRLRSRGQSERMPLTFPAQQDILSSLACQLRFRVLSLIRKALWHIEGQLDNIS